MACYVVCYGACYGRAMGVLWACYVVCCVQPTPSPQPHAPAKTRQNQPDANGLPFGLAGTLSFSMNLRLAAPMAGALRRNRARLRPRVSTWAHNWEWPRMNRRMAMTFNIAIPCRAWPIGNVVMDFTIGSTRGQCCHDQILLRTREVWRHGSEGAHKEMGKATQGQNGCSLGQVNKQTHEQSNK